MKELNIREMRASLGQLAELVAAEGELVIRRRGEPIARVLPMTQQRRPPDHADLRQRMPLLETASADLIRAEKRAYLDTCLSRYQRAGEVISHRALF